ncbi:MAG: hypothetical protein QW291_06905 [Thermofilaceae archaeon]
MIVATFSGSKGGTGKTTLASFLSLVSSTVVPTLLIDASADGGATSYLVGEVSGPYLSESPSESLRSVNVKDLKLTISVNRGPIRNVNEVIEFVKSLGFKIKIIDLPALTDVDTVGRYMPLIEVTDTILVVTEPNPASVSTSLYTFGDKHVIIALNQPRPYYQTIVEYYRKVIDNFCKKTGCQYVVIPYDSAVARLSPQTLKKTIDLTSEEFDASIVRLLELLIVGKM